MGQIMIFFRVFAALSLITQVASAQATDGVIIRCGASSGNAFFFNDETMNPDGPSWEKDGISKGKIILVRYGEEWDILFDDTFSAHSYRQDGAKVIPLLEKPGMLTVGAFNADYADIYTFDLINRIVAWSSNKLGPFAPKVAVYDATCE